jgi:hypothetical protein
VNRSAISGLATINHSQAQVSSCEGYGIITQGCQRRNPFCHKKLKPIFSNSLSHKIHSLPS